MDDDAARAWTVLAERELLSCPPFLAVSVQSVGLPDGRRIDDFYQLAMPDYACIFAVAADGRALMMRSYRHGPRRLCLNFPGGHLAAGEEPLAAAKRELLEELGCAADDWATLGSFVTNANHRCQTAHFFRAARCRRVADPHSDDLEEAEIVAMTEAELWAALRRGEFAVMSQVALLALATCPQLGAAP